MIHGEATHRQIMRGLQLTRPGSIGGGGQAAMTRPGDPLLAQGRC